MAVEAVKEYFKQLGKEGEVQEFPVSSATVELAAQALSVQPAQIAKTLAFEDGDSCILVAAAGDAKTDNRKFKDTFGKKGKMLAFDQVEAKTGHPVGGVCPFCNPAGVKVYLDRSLQRFEQVYPACGSANSAIRLSCEELFEYAKAIDWVDVCKLPE